MNIFLCNIQSLNYISVISAKTDTCCVFTELTIKMSIYFIRFSAELGPLIIKSLWQNNVFLCFGTQSKWYMYFVIHVLAKQKKWKKKALTYNICIINMYNWFSLCNYYCVSYRIEYLVWWRNNGFGGRKKHKMIFHTECSQSVLLGSKLVAI